MTGYFGIGIECCKTEFNYGTLLRTANIFGASFLFLIGKRFVKQSSDTLSSHCSIPTYTYDTFNSFYENLPYDCRLVGVELTDKAVPLEDFKHPNRACYLLGVDALTLNYKNVLGNNKRVDYLSLDIEPLTNTLACLKVLPLDEYRFSVITYETDYYDPATPRDVAEMVRKESRDTISIFSSTEKRITLSLQRRQRRK